MVTAKLTRRNVPRGLFLESLEERMCLSTVAYWRFEEGVPDTPAQAANSILDSSSNNLHGTPQNGPLYRADVKDDPIPQTGQANDLSMQFNGANQRVVLADNTSFALTKSLTIEAYIKRKGPQGGLFGQIFFRGDNRVALDPYFLTISGNNLYFHIENASGQQANISSPLSTLDQWFHVAGTLDDASGVMKLYIDGTVVASTVTTIRPFGPLDPTRLPGEGIGGLQADGHCCQFFDGLIDEVRVSDEALSAAQFLNARTNLIFNGDFELGNVGFGTQHLYSPGNIYDPATYDVVSNPRLSHPSAASYGDHTTGSGLMMAVNGAVVADQVVWVKNLKVDPNTPYIFSIWVSNWDVNPSHPVAELEFSLNGVPVGTLKAPTAAGIWARFATGWFSYAAEKLTIRITNRDLAYTGNDFALDDISLVRKPHGAPIPVGLDVVAALGTLPAVHPTHTPVAPRARMAADAGLRGAPLETKDPDLDERMARPPRVLTGTITAIVAGLDEPSVPRPERRLGRCLRIVNGRIDIGAFEVQATGAPNVSNYLAVLGTADWKKGGIHR